MARTDVDTRQDAQQALSEACADLARTAKQASKTVLRGSASDVVEVHALHRAVLTAEEAVDIAAIDLDAANGEDV